MNNLPEGLRPDKDNLVYYDTARYQYYMLKWTDGGNNDYKERIYIPK